MNIDHSISIIGIWFEIGSINVENSHKIWILIIKISVWILPNYNYFVVC